MSEGRRRDRAGEESGAVLVMVAILLPVLLAITALVIDVGNWYVQAHREQNAADAAALAGAVHLPGEPAAARTAALDLSGRNGYRASDDGTTIQVTQLAKKTQLRVTVTREIDNFFGSILGLTSTTITRSAVAEYRGPVPMGSPANGFGDEPLGGNDTARWSNFYSSPTDQPTMWANIAGPKATKVSGDALHAGTCGSGVDGCTSSTNTDYAPDGYVYVVRVTDPPAGKKLAIQVYDPAFVAVGDHCEHNLADATAAVNPYVTDAGARYASGDGPFCTGDVSFGAGDPVTSYVFRSTSDTPWDPLSAPVINRAGCVPTQFPGQNRTLQGPLTAPGGDDALQKVFRQWVPMCTIDTPVAGDYYVQVRTNLKLTSGFNGSAAPTTSGNGHNRFAIRSAFVDGAGNPDGAGVRIFASSAMSIYANAPSATTKFHLARVPSGSAGNVLVLNFFDIADASQPGKLKILAPDDSGMTFTNCTGTGPQSGSLPDCVINANSSFNGKWQRVRVPIPDGYSCADASPTGCWVRIEYKYGAGVKVQDTTTWSASMEGDPVRLVE